MEPEAKPDRQEKTEEMESATSQDLKVLKVKLAPLDSLEEMDSLEKMDNRVEMAKTELATFLVRPAKMDRTVLMEKTVSQGKTDEMVSTEKMASRVKMVEMASTEKMVNQGKTDETGLTVVTEKTEPQALVDPRAIFRQPCSTPKNESLKFSLNMASLQNKVLKKYPN